MCLFLRARWLCVWCPYLAEIAPLRTFVEIFVQPLAALRRSNFMPFGLKFALSAPSRSRQSFTFLRCCSGQLQLRLQRSDCAISSLAVGLVNSVLAVRSCPKCFESEPARSGAGNFCTNFSFVDVPCYTPTFEFVLLASQRIWGYQLPFRNA